MSGQASDFETRLGTLLARWVTGAASRPALVLLGFAALVAVSLFLAATRLGIEGSTEALFSQDLAFKQIERGYYDAFPDQFEPMFVVVDATTPERAGVAAQALAEHLSAEPALFPMVFLPGGGSFFERQAFLYLDTDALEELSDQLAQAQPYLAELSRDGSLRGFASILARGARATREGDFTGDQLGAIYDRFTAALEASAEGRPYTLSWTEVVAAREFEEDPRRRVILVQPTLDTNDLQPAAAAIASVRASVEALGLEAKGDVRVRITGDVALSFEELEVVQAQAAAAGLASFVLVGVILAAGLRSLRLVLSTLLTLMVGLVLTAGLTTLTVGRFNMISVAFAVLFIGLGVDFAIHFCVRYRERLGFGESHEGALDATVRDVGSSLALCAFTTAIGFFAFAPTPFVGVAELGIISGGGMLVSFFCTLTLLPALLSLPPKPRARSGLSAPVWTGKLIEIPVRFPRAVRGLALVLALGAAFLLPQARFDNNTLNVRDPGSESVQALRDLLEDSATSPWSLNVVADDVEDAERVAERLRALPEVERVVTLGDFVPDEQDEKLSIIEDLTLFLEPLDPEPGPDATSEERREALVHLADEAGKLARDAPDTPFGRSASRLVEALGTYLAQLPTGPEADRQLDGLEESLLGTLPEQLRLLEAALGARPIALDDLPEELVAQMQAADGRARVQIFPRRDVSQQAELAAFLDAVRAVEPRAAGPANEMVESARTVVGALQQALLLATLAVTLVMLFLWRRWTDTALVLLPLALASALTVAAAVLLDIPFNFADVIVLPLLLGIGVDSGIHLVHRARSSGDVRNLLGTSTARAVGYSAMTTIASFGTMGFASHLGLATLGQLLTLGVAMTLFCNLIVLPALIQWRWLPDAASVSR
ncbi:MAG: MMPL family transporter [Myxococcota bacterium]